MKRNTSWAVIGVIVLFGLILIGCASTSHRYYQSWESAQGETEPMLSGTWWKEIEEFSDGSKNTRTTEFQDYGQYNNGTAYSHRWQRDGNTVKMYPNKGYSEGVGTISYNDNGVQTITGVYTLTNGSTIKFTMTKVD
ncbi:hypothetical protein LQZ19_14210 [Treponema primitia]|uniref:hypothetical protein n=1 Tax=Treponema primitia TaxID=88058 RepID=UPI00398068A5